jgi:hypothetical protein
MLFYRAALPLSSRTLNFVSGIIRRHRKVIGSLRRRLDAGQQHPAGESGIRIITLGSQVA